MKFVKVFPILTIIILIPILFAFFKVNELNYYKYKNIQANIVEHPEKIPTAELAKFGSFGFMNMAADIYWLQTVQYIGGNVTSGDYKKYLFVMMDLITELNPYFESPYTIGQLLLPSSDGDYEKFTTPEALKGINQGEQLGLKGITNFCDAEKVSAIIQETDLQKVFQDAKYKDPCKSYKIPYYLAYIYYFYKKDGAKASDYYKVVAAQSDAPTGAKVLAAIMQGKGGERQKSLYMFLSLAKSVESKNESCGFMIDKLQTAYNSISQNNIPLDGFLISAIQNDIQSVLPKLNEENEKEILDDTKCSNYLTKAVREINLMYLEQADKAYIGDYPDETSAHTSQKLFDLGYINFNPTDYQQYEDEDYGIVYEYNDDIKRFDYSMGY